MGGPGSGRHGGGSSDGTSGRENNNTSAGMRAHNRKGGSNRNKQGKQKFSGYNQQKPPGGMNPHR